MTKAAKTKKPVGIRTFTLMAEISAPMPGGLDDWPANIQDGIYAALEAKSKEVKLPLAIIKSWCDSDFDGKWYAYCLASEIVAAPANARRAIGILH